MAGLVIGSISLEVQDFTENEPRIRGEDMETFNNDLRSSASEERREFSALTAPVTTTVRDNVNAAIANRTPVNVSGDCLGTTIECIVKASWRIHGAGTTSFEHVGTLTIRATGG